MKESLTYLKSPAFAQHRTYPSLPLIQCPIRKFLANPTPSKQLQVIRPVGATLPQRLQSTHQIEIDLLSHLLISLKSKSVVKTKANKHIGRRKNQVRNNNTWYMKQVAICTLT